MHPIILQGVACQTTAKEALLEREKQIENWLEAEPTLTVMVGIS